ncbi:MAG TPA: AI-2E family transporter [Bacteroidia bacterium]|jgi:predicted PurR-regulated permease PerM|nr:AI-2E family transporter [Bacteroidia bacterium]
METPFKIPFYAKIALISVGIFAFVFIMKIGQQIIIPLIFSTIIAILLNPIVSYLIQKKVNKMVSITIAVAVATFVVLGIFYIISSQVTMFSDTYPQLKEKFNASSTRLINWISGKFDIRQSKINAWIKETQSDTINNFAIGETVTEAVQIMVILILLPVYLFMILYYKSLLLEFIRRLFRLEHHVAVAEVLTNSKKIIQNYLVGLFFEMIIIAILNSAGLLLLGIDYAIILGITGAIVNIIPYIGGIIAIALPMIIAFVTKDSLSYSALVFVVYIFIQFIDNHYIIPKIVASRVQINALISVIVVLIGGALWGVPGMFLSIPLTAIIKVIFDHIESLKPWGFLLGNIVPTASRFSFIKQKTAPD